jgi:hypothetical protein
MKRTLILFGILVLIISKNSYAQEVPHPALTADSLASGNYKDVLKSFFQLSFEKFTGPDKELKFTSTPFAVMAKLDSTLLVDRKYLNYRTLRNINFSFSAKLDSVFKFNGFSSEVKYAIINKRDETVSRAFTEMVLNDESVKELMTLNTIMNIYVSKIADIELAKKTMTEIEEFRTGKKKFDELELTLQNAIIRELENSPSQNLAKTLSTNKQFSLHSTAVEIYEKFKKEYNNNLLWTISLSDTTYKDQFAFSSLVLNSELLQGISSQRKNDVELNIKTALQFADDIQIDGKDLKRRTFSFEPGINIVLKTKNTRKSFFEFKLSGGYTHIFSSLYDDEERNQLTLNGTLRIRVIDDIWVPVEFKYDPESGNVFGFLNVKANFTALKGIGKFLKL